MRTSSLAAAIAAAVMPDSTKKDSTMNAAKDTAAAATPDTSKKNGRHIRPASRGVDGGSGPGEYLPRASRRLHELPRVRA
jgi:hypothetical protein